VNAKAIVCAGVHVGKPHSFVANLDDSIPTARVKERLGYKATVANVNAVLTEVANAKHTHVVPVRLITQLIHHALTGGTGGHSTDVLVKDNPLVVLALDYDSVLIFEELGLDRHITTPFDT
jgi:hypothetical protein